MESNDTKGKSLKKAYLRSFKHEDVQQIDQCIINNQALNYI